jgi:hypothetical protein
MGGSAFLAHEFNQSDKLKKLAECIAEATKSGVPLQQAQKNCHQLYGDSDGALVSVGGFDLTTLTIIGVIGLGAIVLLSKVID